MLMHMYRCIIGFVLLFGLALVESLVLLLLLCTIENSHNVGIQALKMAIDIHVQSSPLDGERLSRCYHSLVQLVLRRGGIGDAGEEEEGWKVLNKVLDLLDSTAKVREVR